MFNDTGRLLVAFLLGSVATVIGTLVAFKALPLTDMGADGWKVSLACRGAYLCHHATCDTQTATSYLESEQGVMHQIS